MSASSHTEATEVWPERSYLLFCLVGADLVIPGKTCLDERREEIAISYLSRLSAVLALAMLMAGAAKPVSAQVSAVKDAWLVMKVHSEMVDEVELNGSNIDVDVKNGVV